MKKLSFVACLLFITATACKNSTRNELPSFELLLMDSTTILKTSEIPKGKPFIFIYFSPDCEHCQEETKDLLKNMNSLEEIHLYFVTVDAMDRLKIFNEYYRLARFPNITLARDYKVFLPNYFAINVTPFIAIYDRHRELKHVLVGNFPAHQIIEEMNKF